MTSEHYSGVAGGTAETLYVDQRHLGEAFDPATAIPQALLARADQVIQ